MAQPTELEFDVRDCSAMTQHKTLISPVKKTKQTKPKTTLQLILAVRCPITYGNNVNFKLRLISTLAYQSLF